MGLRTRLLLSMVLLALIPLLLFGIAAYISSTTSLIDVERDNLKGAVKSAELGLTEIQNSMAKTVHDYSNWDDTHTQTASGATDSDYIKANIDPSNSATITNTLGLQLVGFFKADNSTNYSLGPADSIMGDIQKNHDKLLAENTALTYLKTIGSDVYIISMSAVRTSDGNDPNGFIVFGRKLTNGDVTQIRELTGYDVALYNGESPIASTKDAGVTPAPDALKQAALGNEILDQGNATIALAYSPVKDDAGNIVATLVVWRPRTATVAAQGSITSTLLIGFAFAGILAILVALGVQYSITRPLLAMANTADKIAAGDLNQRVLAPKAHDELWRLANAFNQMSEHVSARYNESLNENQRLQLIDEYRLNLLNAITQELQAPLVSIKNYVESLSMSMYGSLNEAQRRLVAAIERTVAVQDALVADLVDFSSAQQKQLKIVRERLSLDSVARDTIQAVQERYNDKFIQFSSSVASDIPPLFADRIRMSQILENLLNWAYDFSVPNGRVALTAVAQQGLVRISISDTSRGLTPEESARVFELFYNPMLNNGNDNNGSNGSNGANGTHSTNGSNGKRATPKGLGLALAKALIEQHGGTINVEADPGKGNTFTFTIPSTN